MTKREAAIVSAYTGFRIGDWNETHKYIEEIMGRPILSHELGSPKIRIEMKKRSKQDFVSIEVK